MAIIVCNHGIYFEFKIFVETCYCIPSVNRVSQVHGSCRYIIKCTCVQQVCKTFTHARLRLHPLLVRLGEAIARKTAEFYEKKLKQDSKVLTNRTFGWFLMGGKSWFHCLLRIYETFWNCLCELIHLCQKRDKWAMFCLRLGWILVAWVGRPRKLALTNLCIPPFWVMDHLVWVEINRGEFVHTIFCQYSKSARKLAPLNLCIPTSDGLSSLTGN